MLKSPMNQNQQVNFKPTKHPLFVWKKKINYWFLGKPSQPGLLRKRGQSTINSCSLDLDDSQKVPWGFETPFHAEVRRVLPVSVKTSYNNFPNWGFTHLYAGISNLTSINDCSGMKIFKNNTLMHKISWIIHPFSVGVKYSPLYKIN